MIILKLSGESLTEVTSLAYIAWKFQRFLKLYAKSQGQKTKYSKYVCFYYTIGQHQYFHQFYLQSPRSYSLYKTEDPLSLVGEERGRKTIMKYLFPEIQDYPPRDKTHKALSHLGEEHFLTPGLRRLPG